MEPVVAHLHTFLLFPFSIDRDAVLQRHGDLWKGRRWIDGLDGWIRAHDARAVGGIGRWQRSAYTSFTLDSQAYQDMVFFHPFIRRVYFDSLGMQAGEWQGEEMGGEGESQLRFYRIPIEPRHRVRLFASDERGRREEVAVTELRLILFANGIGILSLGLQAFDLTASRALWINEMMRKLYPSSGRQKREGRTPSLVRLMVGDEVVIEEDFNSCGIRNYLPPLSGLLTRLLYFADYENQEYEAVLDERMIVYTYVALDQRSLPDGFARSDDYRMFISRVLYVDHFAEGYRYDPAFIQEQMRQQLYTRWAHQGTYYGFTSYSAVTVCFGERDCDDHLLQEGFLIHRMFLSRYHLMALIALFYRATLLDFAERTALVSRRLDQDFGDGKLSPENIDLMDGLRSEFVIFSNYWHFDELANKDEEAEHFALFNRVFRIDPMKTEIGQEVERLNSVLNEYYQRRNTMAVNRLAMLSMILGGGAVLTGFFGMNFGAEFAQIFFQPPPHAAQVHWAAMLFVTIATFGALLFGLVLIIKNWEDYRDVLLPRGQATKARTSIRRVE
ncbi:MAG: CorA family divalent cation transporter [Bryobacteraceae bacterium]|nr:CorA family divalent cation transporter [Bryobacteraceae bacterium]